MLLLVKNCRLRKGLKLIRGLWEKVSLFIINFLPTSLFLLSHSLFLFALFCSSYTPPPLSCCSYSPLFFTFFVPHFIFVPSLFFFFHTHLSLVLRTPHFLTFFMPSLSYSSYSSLFLHFSLLFFFPLSPFLSLSLFISLSAYSSSFFCFSLSLSSFPFLLSPKYPTSISPNGDLFIYTFSQSKILFFFFFFQNKSLHITKKGF